MKVIEDNVYESIERVLLIAVSVGCVSVKYLLQINYGEHRNLFAGDILIRNN